MSESCIHYHLNNSLNPVGRENKERCPEPEPVKLPDDRWAVVDGEGEPCPCDCIWKARYYAEAHTKFFNKDRGNEVYRVVRVVFEDVK